VLRSPHSAIPLTQRTAFRHVGGAAGSTVVQASASSSATAIAYSQKKQPVQSIKGSGLPDGDAIRAYLPRSSSQDRIVHVQVTLEVVDCT
jgi:hypothetical protein